MKKNSFFVILVLTIIFFSQTVFAGMLENGKKDRKGFFIGIGPGSGALNLRGAGFSTTKYAFQMDFKIGGAINEKLLLMYDNFFSYSKIDGINFSVYSGLLAAQWFLYDGLYVRPGVGFGLATASTSAGGVTVSASSKTSFSAQAAAGYEFRIGKYFAVGPELFYNYLHVKNSNAPNGSCHNFGAIASMMWYF